MVNDLPKVVSKCEIMLYAEDAVIYFSSKHQDEIEKVLNQELKSVQEWVQINKLALNPIKTEFMLFGSTNKLSKIQDPIQIKLDDHQIVQVDTFKYLGVYLDSTLNWKEHVTNTSKKVGTRIALLGRLKRYLPVEGLKLLASALVLPLFEYCSNAWSNCSQGTKDILIRQHKRMARMVLGVETRTPTKEVLDRLHWVSIEERWI